jgi:hypothetical protein
MENIILQPEEPTSKKLPLKKRPPSAEQLYKSLVTYPISKEVSRYPRQTDTTIQPAFHNLLQTNLDLLVPNIDIGYQMSMNSNQMFEWILTAKEYVNKLNEEFQQRCDKKTQKIMLRKINGRMIVIGLIYFPKILQISTLFYLPLGQK